MKPGTVAIVQKRKDRIQAPPFVELAGYYMQTAGFLFYCPWLVSGHPHAKTAPGAVLFLPKLESTICAKEYGGHRVLGPWRLDTVHIPPLRFDERCGILNRHKRRPP